MRRALPIVTAAALAVAVTPLTGCFVFDELEAGEKIMDSHSPHRNKKKSEAEEAATSGTGEEESKPTGQAWWSQARSLNSGPADDEDADAGDPSAVVRCELAGATRFMRRGDCLSQGGRLASR